MLIIFLVSISIKLFISPNYYVTCFLLLLALFDCLGYSKSFSENIRPLLYSYRTSYFIKPSTGFLHKCRNMPYKYLIPLLLVFYLCDAGLLSPYCILILRFIYIINRFIVKNFTRFKYYRLEANLFLILQILFIYYLRLYFACRCLILIQDRVPFIFKYIDIDKDF